MKIKITEQQYKLILEDIDSNDDIINILKNFFIVKEIPKSSKLYSTDPYDPIYYQEVAYEINGGVTNGGFYLIINTQENIDNPLYITYYPSGYEYHYDNKIQKTLFGNNAVTVEEGDKEYILSVIWDNFIEWDLDTDSIPNFNKIKQIADSGNYELAFILLSGFINKK